MGNRQDAKRITKRTKDTRRETGAARCYEPGLSTRRAQQHRLCSSDPVSAAVVRRFSIGLVTRDRTMHEHVATVSPTLLPAQVLAE